jgi:1-deoxy-D-xylulose-5-phosphate reductoisomerase
VTDAKPSKKKACQSNECETLKRITILGATGSIGTSALDLISRSPEAFEIVALTAQANAAKLASLAVAHRARLAVIGDPGRYGELKERLAGSGIEAAAGPAALVGAAERPADCVIAAITGAAGLEPTWAAARQGRRLALANKECLVSAGGLFMATVKAAGTELIPIDSEHSAAFQLLAGADPKTVERIVLTASGGPFRTWPLERLQRAMPSEALRHPNWSMGRKITVDSATLMNKGLELIEAYHLFPVASSQLDVIVHPQSVVHCLVEFNDGSVLAHMGCPDMRTPIAVSLSWPGRMPAPTKRLDLVELSNLSFERPDEVRFPALRLAREALECGGAAPAILNAANEIAVEEFLGHRLGFLDIARTVATCLERSARDGFTAAPESLRDVLAADLYGRELARNVIAAEPGSRAAVSSARQGAGD